MRRIGMKGGKRRKSDTSSDADSGENGGTGDATTTTTTNQNNEEHDGNNGDVGDEVHEKTTPNRKRGRASRGKRDEETASSENKSEADDGDDRPDDNTPTTTEENGNSSTKGSSKKRKREKTRASTSKEKKEEEEEEEQDDGEYEVEKIVAHRTIKGRRQFLVRWKGYGEDADTWEQEKDLNCSKLIEEFLDIEEDKNEEEKEANKKDASLEENNKPTPAKQAKKNKKVPVKRGRASKGEKRNQEHKEAKEAEDEDKEDSKEFEVEKIVEVHFKKNKGREFLIRWKGFLPADDTWEPEENLNCPDLISKFMDKVEKAKTAELRELRTNPAHTKRYTLNTPEAGRRLSRRTVGKQRTTYYQCDD